MENNFSLKTIYLAVRSSRVIKNVNNYVYSPLAVVLWGILTFAAFAFSKELLFYSFVITCGLYVIIFCDDLAPIMPFFTLCYITASPSNNPSQSQNGLFYGTSGKIILCFAAIAVIALFARVTLDENIGWKKFLTKRRALLSGMLALGVTYLISGFGSTHYAEYYKRNIVFALIQFASIFLLYFLFSATVKWENFNMDYFACVGLVPGFVVLAELAWLYLTQSIISDGAIERYRIYTGWGVYNNMGAIIATAIPFAFYFAQKKKHNSVYLILALVLTVGVVFSCSRSSILFATVIAFLSYIYTFIKANNKLEFGITSLLLTSLFFVALVVFQEKLIVLFKNVPLIADQVEGNVVFYDSGRIKIYKEGLKIFLENTLIGQGFYCYNYDLYDFSVIERFSNFFPPRWHNTIVQILATSGIVGLLAYAYHRWQTILLFINKRNIEKIYIVLYVFVLLCMSLLDCHLFNVGPVFFYSTALAVAEYA